MLTIHKYRLNPMGKRQQVALPATHRITGAGIDSEGIPSIWAEVNEEDACSVPVDVFLIGTGHPIPPEANRLLGFTFPPNQFGFHVYINDPDLPNRS